MQIEQDLKLPLKNLNFVETNNYAENMVNCYITHFEQLSADLVAVAKQRSYFYSKWLYRIKYQLLQEVVDAVKGVSYYTFKDNEQVIDPAEPRECSIL